MNQSDRHALAVGRYTIAEAYYYERLRAAGDDIGDSALAEAEDALFLTAPADWPGVACTLILTAEQVGECARGPGAEPELRAAAAEVMDPDVPRRVAAMAVALVAWRLERAGDPAGRWVRLAAEAAARLASTVHEAE